MAIRSDLTLFFGLRFHEAGSRTLRILEALLEEISELESSLRIPLHWNTPLYPLFSGSSRGLNDLITEIKTRVHSRGDVIAPAGFRGALHPLLDDHELTRELSWCRRNPWVPGFKELLGQDPQVTIPRAPDLSREAAAGVYSGAGFQVVGLPLSVARSPEQLRAHHRRRHEAAARMGRLLLYHHPDRAAVMAAWVFRLEELTGDSPLVAALGASDSGHLLLLLDIPTRQGDDQSLDPPGGDRPIARLLDALSHRHSVVPAALSGATVAQTGEISWRPSGRKHPQVEPPLAALLHGSEACGRLEAETGLFATRRQRQAQALRRPGRRRNQDVRSALDLLAGDAPSEQLPDRETERREAAEPGRPGQILFAEMGGVVSLPGPGFVAHFADGRLRGLSRGGDQVLSGLPAECWFDFDGRRCSLQTVSAASFEREGDHGMATAFAFRLEPAGGDIRMRAEAYFREGLPELHLDLEVTFPPKAPRLLAAAPYEIPLFRVADHQFVTLETGLENGEWHPQQIPARKGWLLACGRRIRLSLEGAALVLAEGEDSDSRLVTALPLRVARESGSWVLRACLGGRTCPLTPLSVEGSRSSVSYRILVERA